MLDEVALTYNPGTGEVETDFLGSLVSQTVIAGMPQVIKRQCHENIQKNKVYDN